MSMITIHNMPSQPTSFIGREFEIREIVDLLRDDNCRLLSLVGHGGMGKTRISIEAIQRLNSSDFEHGIFYVQLAPLTSPDQILTAIVGSLGILISEEGSPREELTKFLRGRDLLLVMDNFEHVLDGADIVADILSHTKAVKILTTSREALNLQEEWLWHVRGMRFPDEMTVNDIDHYSGLQLFLDRAKRVRPQFDVDANLSSVIRICQMVGGMPLAIELSASWLKSLTCDEIISEIQRNIDFLQTNVRNIPKRHRSIRAVFDHSWQLCDENEQRIFRRLCIFRGGFRREDAEVLVDATLMDLTSLVEKSMLQKLADGRFKLHRLSRQFADEKAELAGETESLHDAHMNHFADFMAERAIDIKGRRQIAGLNEVEADFYNVRKAWYRAVDTANFAALDKMMDGLALYCDMRALYQIGDNIFEYTLNKLVYLNHQSVHPTYNRIRIRYIQVWSLREQKPIPEWVFETISDCEKAANSILDQHTLMLCFWCKGLLYQISGDSNAAISSLSKGRELAQNLQDAYYEGRNLRLLDATYTFIVNKQVSNAKQIAHDHQTLLRRIGDLNGLAHALGYSISTNLAHGITVDNLNEPMELWNRVGDKKSVSVWQFFQGHTYFKAGELELAKTTLKQSIILCSSVNFTSNHSVSYSALSMIFAIQRQRELRDMYLKKALALSDNLISMRYHVVVQALVVAHIIDNEFQEAKRWMLNFPEQTMSQQRVDILILGACILAQDSNKIQAVEALGLAFTHQQGMLGWTKDWRLLQQLQIDLRTELGSEVFDAAWKRGAALELEILITKLMSYCAESIGSYRQIIQPLAEPLTDRELEVLALIADGLTNPQIAEKLYLSVGTVKVHTRNIYGKLNVNNRTEAATTARDLNLI